MGVKWSHHGVKGPHMVVKCLMCRCKGRDTRRKGVHGDELAGECSVLKSRQKNEQKFTPFERASLRLLPALALDYFKISHIGSSENARMEISR